MAKQTRKQVNSTPVTSHQLFPAVVALWFGALFGLGSLAVRPTLIESLVLKSHIDLIIPATAPPLGVTARILIALLLAGVGMALGITLARRISRPKAAVPERKRSAGDLTGSAVQFRARDAHPDAPARTPLSVHAEFGRERGSGAEAPGTVNTRRRALTIEYAQNEFVPQEFAPLPGASARILDIAAIELGEPAAAPSDSLELEAYPPPATSAPPLDWANAVSTSAPPAQRQELQSSNLGEPVLPQPALDSTAAHTDGRQVFGMAPQPDRTEQPRQIFGITEINGHLPQEFVKAAGYQTTVFDVAEPSPLFAPRTEPEPAVSAKSALAAPLPPEQLAGAAAAPLPSPAELGMTDLATRLSEAMRRRRAAAAKWPQQNPEPVPEVTDPPAGSAQAALAVAAPIPAGYEPAAIAPHIVQAAPLSSAAGPAAVVPEFAAPRLTPQALPSAMRPLALDAFLEEDAALAASLLPPRPITMPAPVSAMPSPPPELVTAFASEAEPGDSLEEENYGSLLGLGPARNPFVRIEDPAADVQAPEPVVIFPGQAPPSAEQAAVFAAPEASEEAGSFRRFAAPSSAGQGQPLAAANNAASAVDPAEAERALRAALSNLQRMSGAA